MKLVKFVVLEMLRSATHEKHSSYTAPTKFLYIVPFTLLDLVQNFTTIASYELQT